MNYLDILLFDLALVGVGGLFHHYLNRIGVLINRNTFKEGGMGVYIGRRPGAEYKNCVYISKTLIKRYFHFFSL